MGTDVTEARFFMQIITGISDYCRAFGYGTEIVTLRHEQNDRLISDFRQILASSKTDGVILPSVIPISEGVLGPFLDEGRPLVLINRYLDQLPIDCVVNDDLWVGRYAGEHLLQQGHVRIGFIGGFSRSTAMRDRFSGFRDALLDADAFDIDLCSFHEHVTVAAGHEGMCRLLDRREQVTAVFCANDESAFGAIKAIREAGLSVPHDISVIGHDGLVDIWEDQVSLTTFKFRLYDLGYAAAQLLSVRLGNPQTPPQHLVMRPSFVVGSTVRSIHNHDNRERA